MEQMFGPALNASYPKGMTESMAQVVDRSADEAVKEGLARMKSMRRPPTLVEFQRVMDSTPSPQATRNVMNELVAYATKHLSLTSRQLREPWTFVFEGDARANTVAFIIQGVRIPADHDAGKPEIMLHVQTLS
jgi:hypothetical protein